MLPVHGEWQMWTFLSPPWLDRVIESRTNHAVASDHFWFSLILDDGFESWSPWNRRQSPTPSGHHVSGDLILATGERPLLPHALHISAVRSPRGNPLLRRFQLRELQLRRQLSDCPEFRSASELVPVMGLKVCAASTSLCGRQIRCRRATLDGTRIVIERSARSER